ncbi:MAG: class I SAM-dependent methyltransferase [Candidatus Hydrogenedentes bacterium]|nr:class I SAM-dependent methyltransferase [Candidatus Hydrogenedentota bacterium]
MKAFAEEFINPYVAERGYRRLCEIGAQYGDNTDRLIRLGSVHVTVIDPCLEADLCAKNAGNPHIDMRRGLSLDVLGTIDEPFDCILIDGDHNWYTVYHELKLIRERGLLVPGGTLLIHDACWPYARRDMYYQPDMIPAEFVHPHACKGIVKGQSELADADGVNEHLCNAVMEGGPRNGVLTAVEDFLGEYPEDYLFFRVDAQYGLAYVFRKGDPAATQAFRAYRAGILRRFRIARLKRWLDERFPRLYAVLRRARQMLRGA